MTSSATAKFMAAARIGRHFGRRPGTPNDQACIESFFGHLRLDELWVESVTIESRGLADDRRDIAAVRAFQDGLRDPWTRAQPQRGNYLVNTTSRK